MSVPVDEPGDGDRSSPLTPGQRGLWFLHQIQPRDPAYNSCTAIELTGPLQPAALRAAVRYVGLRHDTLRTAFVEVDGEPRQVVGTEPPPLHLVDLGVLPPPVRDAELDRLLRRLAAQPFDLRAGPPVRWVLVRCAVRRHVLVLDVHHIAFDRDSLVTVCRDLAESYPGYAAGRPGPDRAPRHGDVRAVARAWTPQGDSEAGLRYWRATLTDPGPPIRLFAPPGAAAGRGRPAAAVRYGTRHRRDDLGDLAAVCAAENATPFMALLALLACLVHRYTGQRDVPVGAPVALPTERADVVGLLVNVLPLRLRLDGRMSFRSVLRQAREVLLDAFDHREIPLPHIVRAVGGPRSADEAPLFQVLLAYQRAAVPPRLPGLRSAVRPIPAAAPKYQLTVTATESVEGLALDLEADDRHATPVDLAACGRHLDALVRAAGRHPDTPVDRLELVDADERLAALRAAVGPSVPRPDPASLSALVCTAARDNPDAIAVLAVDANGDRRQLSYAMLCRAAATLAGRLGRHGPLDDRPVAVLQRRGVGMPVSYLAVLLAGGAILPLDPDDPDARLARLLADSRAALVIADEQSRDRAGRFGLPTIAVAEFLTPPGSGAAGVPRAGRSTHPEQSAYVLFTSGSTGEPKGVAVPHRGIVNRVRWMQETLPLTPGERVLFKTSISFDVSVPELFWPLSAGGCLVVAESGGERDPGYLLGTLRAERVAYTHFVPSMLAPFLAEAESRGADLPALRLVACSGEALPDELSQRAGALLDAEVHNLYGPTEASVEVLHWRCDPSGRYPVALGRPIANTECHLLDERLRPVPRAAVAELHLGGECVARGYLHRPGMTAASFLPAPSGGPGRRLYRTGDFGYRDPDGVVHLVGRQDRQVKILGRRVEPGEVSEAFRRQSGIVDAAVVLRGNQLAAFVVADGGAAPDRAELLAGVRAELPAQLVPAFVEFLPRLPVTQNGKADLRELGRLAAELTPRPIVGTAPRTELERRLATVWCAVLGVPEIDVHDGFFDAGGDSLALLRLHRRLVAEVSPELTVRELFHFPTVAALAEHLTDGAASRVTARASAARAVARAERRRLAVAAARPARFAGPGRGGAEHG
ncbi:amino acid adenylation domain-containing protein [Plantactinospora sp. KLBMP9567]|uniref:non-ribosomal peptide synthetase n=1 Tax=Plantactinospora sp. KLBMP9567 TaxID=3085900 RepID=UPI002980A827|nr:amino acid adenylation domain-containing protein [Plantactinospora sp. KLBMP9567]MDW5324847.1 amino acid adenylation domain-containing protein [Plantactinospora sp. KLBMP9567]